MLRVWSLRKQNTETPSKPAPPLAYIPHSEVNSCRPLGPSRQSRTALNRSTLPRCLLSQRKPKPRSRFTSGKSHRCGSAPYRSRVCSACGDESGSLEKRDFSRRQGPVLINASGPGAGSGHPHLGDSAPPARHTYLGTVLRK